MKRRKRLKVREKRNWTEMLKMRRRKKKKKTKEESLIRERRSQGKK